MSSRQTFLNFQKKIFFTFIYLFLAFSSLTFGLTTLSFLRFCSEQKLMLLQLSIFDVGFPIKYLRCWNVVFLKSCPDENLTVYQYHYNSLFPKICKVSWNFIFSKREFILSASMQSFCSIWKIFESLQLVARKEKVIFDLVWFTDETQVPVFWR